MGTDTIKNLADEYFYSINSLAKRIGDDVSSTKEAYDGLWNTLSIKEQNQAIDETIIQPEVALKYATKKSLKEDKDLSEYYPTLKIQTGLKYVIDETGSTLKWKDEHSAPFSFMTQSQMNLNCFEESNQIKSSQNFNGYLVDSPRFASPIQIQRVTDVVDDGYDSSNQLSFYQSDSYSSSAFFKGENVFPKSDETSEEALLETPGSYNSFQSSNLQKETEIPKTGFEFLDNW